MNTRLKTAFSAASILIVATGAAGCGGGSSDKASGSSTSASASASTSDFCGAFTTFEKDLGGIDPSGDPKTIVAKFKSEATKLGAVGTPSNISSSAKSGFTAVLDAINGLPADASLEDLSKLDSSLSATDKKNGQAFETYLAKECPALGVGASATASPS